MAQDDKRLTLLGHLVELRTRLTRSVIAIAITTAISFVFYQRIFDILLQPAQGFNFIFVEMTEMIGTIMRVCLASGIVLAVPWWTYELIMFVSPALTRREKKYVFIILPWIALMFAGGVVFAYFVLIPPALKFLFSFGTEIATPQIKIGNYISLITRLLLAVGLVFELPVITTFLARLGVVSPKWLASKRKVAFILAFVLAAIITPTFDPINQSLVALPLVVLYELSIWLARLVYRKRSEPALS
ncbi:MAG: twin-arginine translocase subunit TatC [Chloroflexota bacterium]